MTPPDQSKTQRLQAYEVANQQATNQPVMLVNLLYMEDFDPEVDPEFIKRELRPYFSGVFADLALRST